MEDAPKGWYSRGYLPHFDGGEIPQFLTFHLADSFPAGLRERWQDELALLEKTQAERERRRRIEASLDIGYGEAWLRNPTVAAMVEKALLFFHGERCRLHAWVVMPNHVHVLFTPILPYTLDRLAHSWKSFTANQANKLLARSGHFWFPESYDRFIRDETHLLRVVDYIVNNPVKAGLCVRPEDWPWSSASWERKRGPGC